MSCRITIICDNTAGPLSGTLGEHGFAALVETQEGSLLFDTGQGETLLHNAQRMNKNLHSVNKVALSHGHYDHTGGLWPLLRSCGAKDIFAHPAVFGRRYRVKDNGESISIGMPYSEEFIRGLGGRFSLGEGFREISPGIFLTGEVPRTFLFESGDAGLFCDEAGCVADTIGDDQSLVIVTSRGLVLLFGCCHAGMINTLDYACAKTGIDKVYAVIGGTHLAFSSKEQLDETITAVRRYDIKKISGSHCTGFTAAARLLKEFPSQFHQAQVGYTLEV